MQEPIDSSRRPLRSFYGNWAAPDHPLTQTRRTPHRARQPYCGGAVQGESFMRARLLVETESAGAVAVLTGRSIIYRVRN
jgi:hypothetical protein